MALQGKSITHGLEKSLAGARNRKKTFAAYFQKKGEKLIAQYNTGLSLILVPVAYTHDSILIN